MAFQEEIVRVGDERRTERLIDTSINTEFDDNIDEEIMKALQASIESAEKENNERYYERKYSSKIEYLKLQDEENRRLEEFNRQRNKEKMIESRMIKFRPIMSRLTKLKLGNPNIQVLIKLMENLIEKNKYIEYYFYDDFMKNLTKKEFEILEEYFLPYESDEE